MKKQIVIICVGLLFLNTKIFGQDSKIEKLKIFIDCNQEWLCDQTYLRNELKMVDFVRDRFLCDVQVVNNTIFSTGGGENTNVIFLGKKKFNNVNDTLSYFNIATATEAMKREKMVKFVKLGLVKYLSKTSFAEQLDISYSSSDSMQESKAHDPWNLWQFTLGSSGFFNGDKNQKSSEVSNSISATRESVKNKFGFEVSNNLIRNSYSFYDENTDTTQVIKAKRDAQDAFARYLVKGNEHWAYGGRARFARSVFDNISARSRFVGTVEYSIFPYSQFNTKRLIVGYDFGIEFSKYRDTTIYLKLRETRLKQSFFTGTSLTQKWGSINLGAEYSMYLSDLTKNNLFFGGGISWNVFKGMKFSIGGNVSLQHDQISIPKQGASLVDLLAQRRIIASSYDYFVGVGFSYTFGSIFNSQVNPTFRGLNYSLNF